MTDPQPLSAIEQCEADLEQLLKWACSCDVLNGVRCDVHRTFPEIGQRMLDNVTALAARDAEIGALADFKAYVHKRLDDAGIETHPDGPHSASGCRIGDRLDIVFAEIARLRELVEQAEPHVQRSITRLHIDPDDWYRRGSDWLKAARAALGGNP